MRAYSSGVTFAPMDFVRRDAMRRLLGTPGRLGWPFPRRRTVSATPGAGRRKAAATRSCGRQDTSRARALSTPDAGAARVDREPDRDRAISREARQEGTGKWHTYRHSAPQGGTDFDRPA